MARRRLDEIDALLQPVRRSSRYADRPYADMAAFPQNGKWCVRLHGREAGPCPSKTRAIAAAIETAKKAERAGKTARVQVQTESGESRELGTCVTKTGR